MLKTACALTGDNYQLVVADTPASKKKIVTLSLALLVPVLLWTANGFLMAYQVLKASFVCSCLVALVCGLVIFIIEKLIIMASESRTLTRYRYAIGFIIALLGGIALDEIIFKNDIDPEVTILKEKYLEKSEKEAISNFEYKNDYTSLNQQIQLAEVKYDSRVAEAMAEAGGKKGTGIKGVGPVTNFKNQKAEVARKEWEDLKAKKAILEIEKQEILKSKKIESANAFNENGLLIRIKALFRLVFSDIAMAATYLLFTALLFFLEFLVVILKKNLKKTNYERKLEMIEEIGQRRIEFLQRKDSPLTDPGNYLPQYGIAREAIKKNSSLYN